MNPYEQKIEARRERLEARADRLRAEGHSRIDRAHKMAEAIPFGQPILIGHHSEGRDRNYRGRIHSGFSKGYDALKAAGEASARAEAVGSGGISSDDPDAIKKLEAELAPKVAKQQLMKDANGVIRRHKGEAAIPHLVQLGISAANAAELIKPDFCGRIGFADYQLTNNNANIRRIKARIEHLRRQEGRETKATETASGVKVVQNAEANRLQIIFPGKPQPEIITELKARGFRWAPSEGAWQRHLSNGAIYAAECVMRKVEA